ncbi:hypothetical protein D041_0516A, partial [Vibrio parahaemolyticus EKP-008]
MREYQTLSFVAKPINPLS